MTWVYMLIGTLLMTSVVYWFGGTIPGLVVGGFGLLITLGQLFGFDIVGRLRPASSERRSLAVSGVWLMAMGLIFNTLLVANSSDNAYLGIALMGFAFFLLGVVFLLSAALPEGIRRAIYSIGLGLFWLIGALPVLMVISALVIIPSQGYNTPFQGYNTNQVFISHLLALMLLVPSLLVIGFVLPSGRWLSGRPSQA